MRENHPDIPFERYADDAICHCGSEAQARKLREALEVRFAMCKLQLHPQKTKIVYCKDSNRCDSYPEQRFDFLGYTFRPRSSMSRAGELFVSFSPAVSDKAAKAMRRRMRRWKFHHRNDLALADIAPRFGRLYVPSITFWCAGRDGNTNDSGLTQCGAGHGYDGFKRSYPACFRSGGSG